VIWIIDKERPCMILPSARTRSQRIRDTLHRLEHDVDAWVSTADPATGEPWLVPLSFHWDGAALIIATPASSATGRNLTATGRVRLGLGTTRDVVLIEGEVIRSLPTAEIADDLGDAFAARTGFDPRRPDSPFRYYWIRPLRIQAWREENELAGRLLMRDGEWLDAVASPR
jgi:hypothetical protein